MIWTAPGQEGKRKRVGRRRGKVRSHFQGIRGQAGTGWGTSEATGRGCEAYRSPGGYGLGKMREIASGPVANQRVDGNVRNNKKNWGEMLHSKSRTRKSEHNNWVKLLF